jgi:hypothetical protein
MNNVIEETEDVGKGAEPAEDQSMADAFDFDVPDGGPDDVSEEGDEGKPAPETGDDEQPAGTEEDTEETAPAKESLDPKLLVRIGRMGLSDTETDRLLGLGNNAAISSVLSVLESRQASHPNTGDGQDGEKKPEWFEVGDEVAEKFDTDLVNTLKSMNSSTRKAVEQMFDQYERRIQDMSNILASRSEDAFEDAVESLGKDWQPVFGKGDAFNIDRNSDAWRNREQLRSEVFSDKYKGSVPRRVKAAVAAMFAEHSEKIAKDALVQKARNRQGQFIGKPAQRKMSDAEMSPRQRAVANASKFMKERGMHPEQTENFDVSEVA